VGIFVAAWLISMLVFRLARFDVANAASASGRG
jgi:hypothetical protein